MVSVEILKDGCLALMAASPTTFQKFLPADGGGLKYLIDGGEETVRDE